MDVTVSPTLENFVPKFLVGGQVVEIKTQENEAAEARNGCLHEMAQVHICVLIQLIQMESIQLFMKKSPFSFPTDVRCNVINNA